MHGLSTSQILEIWEQGLASTEIERGLLLLSYCLPDHSWTQLAAIPIGRRNTLLFELRIATFGKLLNGFAVCPACSGQQEFNFNPEELGLTSDSAQSGTFEFEQDGFALMCRFPDSTDLYAASICHDVEQARSSIASRCIEWNGKGGETSLPTGAIEAFESRLAEQDPSADLSLNLNCPFCKHDFEMALGIVDFLWHEIQSASRHTVLEVDALARTYGWSEAEILGMSSGRRNLYLELVG